MLDLKADGATNRQIGQRFCSRRRRVRPCRFRGQHIVVFDWAKTAGGRHDANAIYLPAAPPDDSKALDILKYHARSLGLDVHTDPSANTPPQRASAA